ncbi:hypothetical protein [Vibrio crassostreae]|uniref:hypothetical protein n=1 Tax=Vibrio crassostreae TaxID=246167 RepID=UPI000634BC8D|nr:hypothetical protein [Vibrio crassostreae]TCN96136.1 hypothetical protein EDB30_11828 [Vibrio crassostreae]CAK1815479.1 conserved hypothetical protein [Vibrio crassostreae]CAK1816512.1 conserved hypothetical protein [Vibrio crassostreae]CAK1817128.1 conserved hypothetical protein [Vibrio crassostreae]CAK1998628.1 conserved hypothetical protein [Vibrio crassostreae]
MPYLNSGSVTTQKSQTILLPIHYGYTPKFLTNQEEALLQTKVSNPAFKTMISAIHNQAGIQSDKLSELTGVTNIAQYRVRLNKQLQKYGLEAKCFKVPSLPRSADFFHWYFVEYMPLSHQQPVQKLEFDKKPANEDTLQ